MKKIIALLLAPVMLLLLLLSAGEDFAASASKDQTALHLEHTQTHRLTTYSAGLVSAEQPNELKSAPARQPRKTTDLTATDTLIAYAMSLIGSPYVYGGTSAAGFDCSGFTSHVYQAFDVPVTRSSATQSADGETVDRTEARPGDLLIFTGTNPSVREPGHVGIVISNPGDTIRFVHSSSNGGVKVSQVEGSGYEARFLDVRRVL